MASTRKTTERLHIDLAKEAYRASNKRDYQAQMTKYLCRLETLDKFSEYLAWKHEQSRKQSEARRSARRAQKLEAASRTALGKRKRAEDEALAKSSVMEAQVQPPAYVRYKISKKAQQIDKRISTDDIENRHQAINFTSELFKFIKATITASIRSPDQLATMRFDIYRRFTITLPKLYHMREEGDDKRKDRIRARPAMDREGRKEAKHAQFDTRSCAHRERDFFSRFRSGSIGSERCVSFNYLVGNELIK